MTAVRMPTSGDWGAVGGEVGLAATIVAVLVVPFFVTRRLNVVVGGVALAGVVMTLAVVTLLPTTASAFGGMIVADPAAKFWRQVLLAFTAGIIGLWLTTTRRETPDRDGPEFLTLLLSATIGLSLMGATANLLMLLLATELASLPSYVLAGFRKTRRDAAEASLKYVLFGAVCTAVMIYGLSLLYGVSGMLDAGRWLAGGLTPSPLATIGLLLVGVGLAFKLAAVPVQFWCPDAFQGAGVDVAAFLSVASKGAAVVLLARLYAAAGGVGGAYGPAAAAAVATVAVATTFVGNLGALRQTSVKRLLAYSSIAHAGYLLSGLAVMPGGTAAVLVYVAVYAAMNLGAFAVVAGVERAAGSDDVSAFNGLKTRSPVAAAAMALCLISMIGLPPVAGLWAKLNIMLALASAGGAWWVVVASVAINSVISVAYYARVLRAMYLMPADAAAVNDRVSGAWLAAACAALLVLSFVAFAPLGRWAAAAVFLTPAM